jgi:hypothetical protein
LTDAKGAPMGTIDFVSNMYDSFARRKPNSSVAHLK